MTRKNKLQLKIKTYIQRRDEIRKRHRVWQRNNPQYLKEVESITRSLSIWRKRIRRIEKKENIVRYASVVVREFTGVKKLNLSVKKQDAKTMQAKRLFCKYAVDNIGNRWIWLVSDFIGGYPDYAGKIRREFTRSFKTNEAHYKLWKDFKNFIQKYEFTHRQDGASSEKNR